MNTIGEPCDRKGHARIDGEVLAWGSNLRWGGLRAGRKRPGFARLPKDEHPCQCLTLHGNVTNTVTLASNTFDPVSDNNSGSATTLIQPSGSTVRILPLGDSFTQGTSKHPSYRYPLWIKLVNSGIDFDLVGSKNSNDGGNLLFPDHNGQSFDSDHEGHASWRADEILARLPKWLKAYTPDIVLVYIGTNDISDDQSTQSTANEIVREHYAFLTGLTFMAVTRALACLETSSGTRWP